MSTDTALSEPQGHPKGLYLLFTTEMWERLSYYGMRALLVLYMTDRTRGGFGWSRPEALKIYGFYTGLVYLTPLLGGFLADRFLGQRRAVVLGGLLMMIGHFLMAVPGTAAFFIALAFLIVGNGFFKPNISTMVGGLYEKNDPRRDGAYTIFYMGINLGAFLAPLVCGTLGEKVGWHFGFGAAGVGMAFGLVAFALGAKRFLGEIGLSTRQRKETRFDHEGGQYRAAAGTHEVTVTEPKPVEPLTANDRDRLAVIGVLTFFNIFFWAAFEQAGGLMNLYTDEKVDRHLLGLEIPTSWFQAINPFFIFTFGPVFSMLWQRLGRAGREPSTPVKFAMGLLLLSAGFVLMLGASRQSAAGGKAGVLWVVGAYFLHTMGELCISPVGLSAINRLAPARLASLMMGVWLLSSFVANFVAGWVGSMAEGAGEFSVFFGIVVVTALVGSTILMVRKAITARMHLDAFQAAPASPGGH
ncbi:MAG: peptide MFS transporter [Myxococcales bacterium]|nr:peptide MFS transporter [Myxococcales bacterium]